MSYESTETSVQDSQPVELYLFTQVLGTDEQAYTSGQNDVTYQGRVFIPATISRSAPSLSAKANSGNITLTVPRTNDFAVQYLDGQPPLPHQVQIFRYHTTDPGTGGVAEFVSFFKGEVKGVNFKKDTASISLSTLAQHLKRTVPKRTFAWSCGHVLFNSLCKVAKQSVRSDVDVVSVSDDGLSLTVSANAAWNGDSIGDRIAGDARYFHGGLMTASTPTGLYSRTIVSYELNTTILKLNIACAQITPGTVLTLFAGCDHSVQICESKFDNVANYGGFPFVPTSNPFADGIITAG